MTIEIDLKRKLNTFDVTSLVIGAIIGADIYVAAALGAKLVGPASLLVWIGAGIMAILIALSFAYSASIIPRTGGPYSYSREALGQFTGFMTGWGLLLAEWFSLAVFPVAFTRYFLALIPLTDPYSSIAIKAAFIIIILITNIFGIKAAGKFNDFLTIGKLAPLILIIGAGLVYMFFNVPAVISNFIPFIRGEIWNFGSALVLIFWAYAGFELSTLPAEEIEQPSKTIPKAIFIGMFIVMAFYLLTNVTIIGVLNQTTLEASQTPLITATATIFNITLLTSLVASVFVGIGAIISIMGADESGTIGTSRLAYAMSIDGFLPHSLSKRHRRFQTPYTALLLICLTAFIASLFGGLTALINASVFLLSFVYLITCVSTIILGRKNPEKGRNLKGKRTIPILGIICSLILISQIELSPLIISLVLLGLGIPIYIFFSPKHELKEAKTQFLSRMAYLKRAYEQSQRFLAHPITHLKWLIYRRKGIPRAWEVRRNSKSNEPHEKEKSK